jgi:hypothetical protein
MLSVGERHSRLKKQRLTYIRTNRQIVTYAHLVNKTHKLSQYLIFGRLSDLTLKKYIHINTSLIMSIPMHANAAFSCKGNTLEIQCKNYLGYIDSRKFTQQVSLIQSHIPHATSKTRPKLKGTLQNAFNNDGYRPCFIREKTSAKIKLTVNW